MMWRAVVLVLLVGCDQFFGLSHVSALDAATDTAPDASGDPSLIAHYSMDAVVNNTVVDEVGGHAAVCQGNCPTPVGGHTMGEPALEFDGTQYLTVAQSPDLDFNDRPYTVAAWIQFSALPADEACFLNQTYESGQADSWQFCIDSLGTLQFFSASGMGFDMLSPAAQPLVLGTWHHVAITHSLVQKSLYFDGHVVATRLVGPPVQDPNLFATYFGADVDNGTTPVAYARGAIDEIRIYNRELADAEVLGLYGMSP